jgi:hypothetical protein
MKIEAKSLEMLPQDSGEDLVNLSYELVEI